MNDEALKSAALRGKLDLTDVSLADLDEQDESVLAEALRRVNRQGALSREGVTAHTSTTHTSTHSNAW